VAAPSLTVFKAKLDGALSTLGWWKVSLPMAGGLELGSLDLSAPFQPKPVGDFMNCEECSWSPPARLLNRLSTRKEILGKNSYSGCTLPSSQPGNSKLEDMALIPRG